MSEFIYLEKVAEQITKNKKFGDYLIEYNFQKALLKQLKDGAFDEDENQRLKTYDKTTGIPYKPKEYERVLFTKPAAVNDWFKTKGVEYWYASNDDTKQASIQEKRLIPIGRSTTELLVLIYQMFDTYNIKPGDVESRMTPIEAWGHIIAQKYKSDLIKEITGVRDTAQIELNGGDEVDYAIFSRTYKRRFKFK